MKLRVNLYVTALQPVKEKISLTTLVGSVASISALLICAGFMLSGMAGTKQAELEVLQQQVKTQTQQIDTLQQGLRNKAPSAALVKQKEELTQTIVQKQKLLQFVHGEQRKTSVKFSPVFAYLAAIDSSGFWLDSFSLNATSSQFSGYVTQPELLPEWINRLGGAPFFTGHTFAQFELKKQDNNEALAFRITSVATKPKIKEVKK